MSSNLIRGINIATINPVNPPPAIVQCQDSSLSRSNFLPSPIYSPASEPSLIGRITGRITCAILGFFSLLKNNEVLVFTVKNEKETLQEILDDWSSGCDEAEESRLVKFIMDCYDQKAESMHISSKRMSSLPEVFSFSGFKNLKTLNLSESTYLRSLPESISSLENLETVYAGYCKSLDRLPQDIGLLKKLKFLDFEHCISLRFLPDSFGQLSSLHTVLFWKSAIITLPSTIENLTKLRVLSLKECYSLRALPNEILKLPFRCRLDLERCRLSNLVRDRLIRAARAEGYRGPRICFLSEGSSKETLHLSIETALTATFFNANEEPLPLINLLNLDEQQTETITNWLNRLRDTADANSAGKSGFYRTIIGYLQLAENHSEFRELFLQILQDASLTCGDRVSLSILHLGIAARKVMCDKSDLKMYVELLKGLKALELLEKVARAKVETLPFVDEIEVYLGYPVKLKDALNLPIDIDFMRFYGCSGITEADLQSAKAFVLSAISNPDLLLAEFVKNDDWVKALKSKYSDQFALIEISKEQALDADEPNYIEIEKDYHQALISLSKEALA